MTTVAQRVRFLPSGNRILVKPIDQPDTSPGGIALPDTARDREVMEGKILLLGPPSERLHDRFAQDQHVLFMRFSATELVLNGDTFLVVNADDVLGIKEFV